MKSCLPPIWTYRRLKISSKTATDGGDITRNSQNTVFFLNVSDAAQSTTDLTKVLQTPVHYLLTKSPIK